jgi:RHS repeat-associated protein
VLISENYLGEKTYYVYGLGFISEEKNSEMSYYHFDFKGSTVALTDAEELVTDAFAYDIYGKVRGQTGSSATMFKYVGQYGVTMDTDTLYFMMTRYYSTDTRRFINQDTLLGSIVQSLSTNQFAYLKGNPTGYVDPDGRFAIPIIYGIGKAIEVGLTLVVAKEVLERLIIDSSNEK